MESVSRHSKLNNHERITWKGEHETRRPATTKRVKDCGEADCVSYSCATRVSMHIHICTYIKRASLPRMVSLAKLVSLGAREKLLSLRELMPARTVNYYLFLRFTLWSGSQWPRDKPEKLMKRERDAHGR